MILHMSPIESSRTISYKFDGAVLTVTVDGIEDTFEINTDDGVYTDFVSDTLPIMPIDRIEVSDGKYEAWVLAPYVGALDPKREDETEEQYNNRAEAYQQLKESRTEEI